MWLPNEISKDAKHALLILAVGHIMFIGIAVGNASIEHGQLATDVEFVEATVNDGDIIAFTLTVINRESQPIRPVVRVHHEDWHIQNAWATQTDVIPPKSAVKLRARLPTDDHRPAPNVGTETVLIISNASTQERRVFGPFAFQNESHEI